MVVVTINSGKDDMEFLDDTIETKSKPNKKVNPSGESEKEKEEEGDELQLAQQIVQTYNLNESPEDVIEYLKSLEGKKNLKYQIASDHYGMKKLETERDYYKRLAEVFISAPPNGVPVPVTKNGVSVPITNPSGADSEADEDLIKYQRELANTWGPFMMMRDQFNPPPQNSGSGAADRSEIVNAINQQSSAIASLAGQMGGGQVLEQAKSVIDLVKSVKEVLTESESDKRKALEEETKRQAIEANKDKVAKLVELVKNSGNPPPLVSMEESFRYTEQKFNVGLVNTIDYKSSKNQLTRTQSDLLQAKYEYIFKVKVLDFYRGKELSL